jgi:class 3 adenylate cyclase/DNA-binding CsgD family transcriptional regulator/tetratricopeptide (TPR) repeat protein
MASPASPATDPTDVDQGIATIAFVDVEGSTSLVDRVGDRSGTDGIARQLGAARDLLDRHGGREVKSLGDGLMLLFVSPRRAVAFALAVQRALAGTTPRVRIGINAGEVLDRDTDPVGGTVNAAARIADRAAGGEVLVSDVVRQLIGTVPGVRVADRGRVRLKGFRDRWHLWAVDDHPTAEAARATIGREAERVAVHDLLVGAVGGSGGTLVLEGEAGIGKSHLLGEAVALAHGLEVKVIEITADEVTRRPGLLPFALATAAEDRPAGGRLRELLSGGRRPGDVEDLSFAIVEASVDAVDALAGDEPVLVVADDAQWADDLSLGVLRALVRRMTTGRVAAVVAMRPTPRPTELDRLVDLVVDGRGRRLRVDALDPLDTQALAAAITGAAPGTVLRQRLDATAGNPLYVTELLRALDDEGLLSIHAGVADVPPAAQPEGLSETLVRRLSWLPAPARELLRLASLLGTTFTLGDLATVTGRPVIDVAADLRDAAVAGLVVGGDDHLRFRHDLVRDAVYDHMLPAERRDLHLAAARALADAGAPTPQVAAQFARGARPGDLDAVAWLQRAAGETIAISPGAAVELYDAALALAPDLWEGRSAILARMIEPLAWCGHLDRAEQAAETVLASSPGDATAFQALRGLSSVYGNRGDIAAAIATIDRAVEAPGAPDDERARLTCFAAQLRVITGAVTDEEARRVGADGLARALAEGDVTLECVAHQVLGCVDAVTGRGEDAVRHAREATALFESGRVSPASYLIPDMFYASELTGLDRFDEAITQSVRSRERNERRGALSLLPMAHMIAAGTHTYAGRYDDALAEIEAGKAVVEDTGSLNFILYLHAVAARIALRRGDLPETDRHLAAGMTHLEGGGSLFGADWLLDVQAERLAAGDGDGALALAEGTWAMTAPIRYFFGGLDRAPLLVRLAAGAGRTGLADEVTVAVDEGARRRPTASTEALALQCRGLATGDGDLLVRAVERYRSSPRRPALARCLEDAAHASTDGPASVAMLSEAAAIHAEQGARGELARVEAALRHRGAALGRRKAERPTFGWDSLTPMEVTVTELVAEGLTNPEIGSRLHISRRTVETHLSHVFRKVDCTSRAQLAAEFTKRAAHRATPAGSP